MNDPPNSENLPPIFRDVGLRVTEIGTHDGQPFILLEARSGRVRRLVVYIQSSQPGQWLYGYEVYDRTTRTKTTYIGEHGDPALDDVDPDGLHGLPGFDDE